MVSPPPPPKCKERFKCDEKVFFWYERVKGLQSVRSKFWHKALACVGELCTALRVANITSLLWARALSAFRSMALMRQWRVPCSITCYHPNKLGWAAKNDNQGFIKKSWSINWFSFIFKIKFLCHRTLKPSIYSHFFSFWVNSYKDIVHNLCSTFDCRQIYGTSSL